MHKLSKKQKKALRNNAKLPKPRKHSEHRRRISNIIQVDELPRVFTWHDWSYKW